MNEYIANNIISETEEIGEISNTSSNFLGLMILVVGIIYIIGIYKMFIDGKKERKLLFAINVGCDLAFLSKILIKSGACVLNIEPVIIFVVAQWIFSIIMYKFIYKFIKTENRTFIIILTTLYLVISIIIMCIIFPNIHIPLQM